MHVSGDQSSLDVWVELTSSPENVLAFDEALLARAATGQAALAISSWPMPAVILGYGQPAEDVDLEFCRRLRIPVLRRITGGTGVVGRGDLFVSLALPAAHPWSKSIIGLYDAFLDALTPALSSAGVAVRRPTPRPTSGRNRSPVCFENWMADTLIAGGGKTVGCAQTRRRASVLIHAAILLKRDADLYAAIFRITPERIRVALAPAGSSLTPDALAGPLLRSFAQALGLTPRVKPGAAVPGRFLDRYRQPRWAPVPSSRGIGDHRPGL